MDIQKLVDDRITELKSEQIDLDRAAELARGIFVHPDFAVEHNPGEADRAGAKKRFASIPGRLDEDILAEDNFDAMNRALEKVAEKVLGITEVLAVDYARLENEMLQSRLAVLQSAESVLDIAISLRDKARNFVGLKSTQREDVEAFHDIDLRHADESDALQFDGGRANMHRLGVASLFQKTQK